MTHIFGVGKESLYHDFPFFQTCKMLPQCSSHEMLEGCAKVWLIVILEHFGTVQIFCNQEFKLLGPHTHPSVALRW